MHFNLSKYYPNYNFDINGVSFIATPKDNTMMFVTSKIKQYICKLSDCNQCLVFVDNNIEFSSELLQSHCIIKCANSEAEYTLMAQRIINDERNEQLDERYTYTKDGVYIGKNVTIGYGAYIEPNVTINRDVIIGKNAIIKSGTTISNAIIGDNFTCNENSVIGTDSHFYTEIDGHLTKIPSFGRVLIGNSVDVGASSVIERGFNGDTRINDNVKIDNQVSIGHDCSLGKNVEITVGAKLAGLVTIGDNGFVGAGAVIRQRTNHGISVRIAMGSVVMTDIADNKKVMGNPAREYSI